MLRTTFLSTPQCRPTALGVQTILQSSLPAFAMYKYFACVPPVYLYRLRVYSQAYRMQSACMAVACMAS